jgi:hypothetical protein
MTAVLQYVITAAVQCIMSLAVLLYCCIAVLLFCWWVKVVVSVGTETGLLLLCRRICWGGSSLTEAHFASYPVCFSPVSMTTSVRLDDKLVAAGFAWLSNLSS